jgi:type III pantothenate kinase
MSQSILAIDAGNSRLKCGLFVRSSSSFYRRRGATVAKIVQAADPFPSCREFLAVPVGDAIPWRTLASWQPDLSVVAGSNPQAVEDVLKSWPASELPVPAIVRDRSAVPIEVDVEFPDKVGLDRLLSAVAANALRPSSRPAIIVDSGTATTVNFVSAEGIFRGGAILPGLEMSAKALHHYTAVLPLIPVQELGGDVPVLPGRNTREAIRNGLFWGQVGAIRELVRQTCLQQNISLPDLTGEQDPSDAPWTVLTGGGGPVLSTQFPGMLSLPSLGMHGLVLTAWNVK